MIAHRSQSASFQSDFYRNKYRQLLITFILSIIVMLGLILAIMYVIFIQPQPNYYASTLTGQVIPMIPRT